MGNDHLRCDHCADRRPLLYQLVQYAQMSLPTDLLNGPYRVVFDIGSFRADFAKACLAAWADCRVECFEPLEPKPQDLPPAVSWHPVALGAVKEQRLMFQCEFIPSSSLLPMREEHWSAFPYTRKHTLVSVQVNVLADYVDLIEKSALLKIDCQGGEMMVLQGAGPALDWFSAVVLEVSHAPLYEGVPSFLEIDRFLAKAGFEHAWRVDELRHPKTNEVLQEDHLWLR